MQQAQRDERNVEDFQKLVSLASNPGNKHYELMTLVQVSDGERNLVRMGDQLLVNGRHRLEVERERKQQENKVREITQQLQINRGRVDQQKVKLK